MKRQNFWVCPDTKLVDEVLKHLGKKNVDYYVDEIRRAYLLPNERISGKWLMIDSVISKKWRPMDAIECHRRVFSYVSRRYRDYCEYHPEAR